MDTFLGLDFGTTNSALAISDAAGHTTLTRYQARGDWYDTFRSVLFFDPEQKGENRKALCTGGIEGILAYLDADGAGRFLQSIKSHLASRSFHSTNILGSVYTLEDLVVLIVSQLRAKAVATRGTLPTRVVAGRPVHFVNDDVGADGDAWAEQRLVKALTAAGFDEVVLELEPVAAAYRYEQRLDHDELVLIADFGGGTTDFCLVRVGPGVTSRGKERVLGTDGVARAGDAFDQRIIQHAVAPRLGHGSRYRVIGGDADVPLWLFSHLARWHHLSFLKSRKTLALLDTILTTAHQPEAIEVLKRLIEEDQGYHLHRAVERVKIDLSAQSETTLQFHEPRLNCVITRDEFDAWIAPDMEEMERAVDRLLTSSGVDARAVDRVFMTGGTSLVPAVRGLFARRFGHKRLMGGEELTSVAQGLALRARDVFSPA